MTNNGPGELARPSENQARTTPLALSVRAVLYCLCLAAAWTAIFTLIPASDLVRVEIGEPSPRNIKAPRSVVYISEVQTEQARGAAAARVPNVYSSPDMAIAANQVRDLAELGYGLSEIRANSSMDDDAKAQAIAGLAEVDLGQDVIASILSMDAGAWEDTMTDAIRVLDVILRDQIRESDLRTATSRASLLARQDLSASQRTVLQALVTALIVPNSFLDSEQTEANRESARMAVEPVQLTIQAGESIVREGDIVTALTLERLQVLGLTDDALRWEDLLGTALVVLCTVLMFAIYVVTVQRDLLARPRRQLLLVLLFIATAFAARLLIPGHVLLPYVFPAAAVAMLVALLFDTELGLLTSIVMAILVGISGGGSIELVIYVLLSSIVGTLVITRSDQLATFLRAGVAVALTGAVVVVAFQLRNYVYDTLGLAQLVIMAVANGIVSASLVFVAFSLIGRAFGIITFMQLLELARPTHPLFRQLLVKAPGTYHHSVVISNMAERAAQAIGADALLSRVGSYYHDIGKTTRPYFFSENQSGGENPHDKLDPKTSAEIIISHTSDGVALAKRYRLPDRVAAFVREHHGTTRVGYFYSVAKAQNDGKPFPDSSFRYPGPKPQSRETAIVMLADGIEAAVRAKQTASRAETSRLVSKIITDRLLDGQLNETELTLHDLDRIRQAFVEVLQGVFHPRIDYPESTQPSGIPTPTPHEVQEP